MLSVLTLVTSCSQTSITPIISSSFDHSESTLKTQGVQTPLQRSDLYPMSTDVRRSILYNTTQIKEALARLGRYGDITSELDFDTAVQEAIPDPSSYTIQVYMSFRTSPDTYAQIQVDYHEADISETGRIIKELRRAQLTTVNRGDKFADGGSFSQYVYDTNTVSVGIASAKSGAVTTQSLSENPDNKIYLDISPSQPEARAIFFRNPIQTQALQTLSVAAARARSDPLFAGDKLANCILSGTAAKPVLICNGKPVVDCPGLIQTLRDANNDRWLAVGAYSFALVSFVGLLFTTPTGIGVAFTVAAGGTAVFTAGQMARAQQNLNRAQNSVAVSGC